MNRASVFEWYKRFKEARESVRDDERCKEVNTPELIGQTVRVPRPADKPLPRPADKHKHIKLHARRRTTISGYDRN